MSLKKVMHPETREVITIDPAQEPRWMFNYLHRSGNEFTSPIEESSIELVASSDEVQTDLETIPTEIIEVEAPSIESTDEVEVVADEVVEMSLEQIQARYTIVTGKEVPARYKNDTEWLLAKING